MRLIPLIPLALLGAGTFVVDYLTPERQAAAARDFAASFELAGVVGTTPSLRASFSAETLELAPRAVVARGVAGTFELPYGVQSFRARELELEPASGAIELRGDVSLGRGPNRLATDAARLEPAGGLAGGRVDFVLAGGAGAAGGFAVGADGGLELRDGLRLRLRRP